MPCLDRSRNPATTRPTVARIVDGTHGAETQADGRCGDRRRGHRLARPRLAHGMRRAENAPLRRALQSPQITPKCIINAFAILYASPNTKKLASLRTKKRQWSLVNNDNK